jgi:hypothetical protein
MIKLTVPTFGKKDALGFRASDLLANLPAFTGRKDRTEEQIQNMVTSLLTEGQIEDVVYRINFDRKPVLVAGVTRALAAERITKQGLTDAKGFTYNEENPFILTGRCKNFKQGKEGDLEALFVTWFENSAATRTPMTEVDQAEFINVLSENFGLNDTQIAEKLRLKTQRVAALKRILLLDSTTQAKLAAGEISFDTAMTAVEIAPEAREAAFATAKTTKAGKVTAAGLAAAAREQGAKTSKSLKRSAKEENAWLKKAIETTAVGPVQSFLFAFVDFKKGVITEADLDAALANLSGEEVEVNAAAA